MSEWARTDDNTTMTMDRRQFLKALSCSLTTPFVLVACAPTGQVGNPASGTLGTDGGPPNAGAPSEEHFFEVDAARNPALVFTLGVASGDPTASGVLLWTRVDPTEFAAASEGRVAFQVARDTSFTDVVARGLVEPGAVGLAHDHIVRVDLHGLLAPGTRYFYRFIFNQTASRTGRCRTLPASDAAVDRLKLVVLTCQDYTNGYYGALDHVAVEDADFVLHLGDFIYESAADPRFQSLPYPDRELTLPSGEGVAQDLADYRAIYRKYRSDVRLQQAMEQHTWIMIWDDHETANDCYWDAANDRVGVPDHPFTDTPGRLNQLKLDSQRAWWEYVPARVTLDENATHPHQALTIYRSFRFGDLAHLVMTDERTYRSPPPCGLGALGERYLSTCEELNDSSSTMLGQTQRQWFLDEMRGSNALWKVWGNEVLLAPLTLPRVGLTGLERDEDGNFIRVPMSADAWDGYQHERQTILQELRDADVGNLLVLTGDLHSAIIARVPLVASLPAEGDNVAAVEMMTPALTSSNLAEIIENLIRISPTGLLLNVVNSMNPHMHYLNMEEWGYMTLTLERTHARCTMYGVDKSVNSDSTQRRVLTQVEITAQTLAVRTL